MSFRMVPREVMAELAAISDSGLEARAGPVPRIRDFHDEKKWFDSFDLWARQTPGPVDSLEHEDLDEIIQAVSRTDLTRTIEDIRAALRSSPTNETTLWNVDHTILLVKAERDSIHDHLDRYVREWVTDSPYLVDEYALLNRIARITTKRESKIAAIMTWYNWPAGFNHLLRVICLQTRLLENLTRLHKLILLGKNPRSQLFRLSPQMLYSEPRPYDHEEFPLVDGLTVFRPPPMSLESNEALLYITASASIRNTRFRTAMARLAEGRAGINDLYVPKHADLWWRGARAWLDSILPKLPDTHVLDWAQLNTDFEAYHRRWCTKVEYQSKRVLREDFAMYRLADDGRVVCEINRDFLPSYDIRLGDQSRSCLCSVQLKMK